MTRPQAIGTARDMFDAGWTIGQIRSYLADRGHRVAWERIKCWVDPDYNDQRKAATRLRARNAWRQANDVKPACYRNQGDREDVLLALRVDDGLSYGAIAAVARRLYGIDTNEQRMRDELLRRGAAKNPNKARAQKRRAEQDRKQAA